jgi:anti-sigma B factor antagonist
VGPEDEASHAADPQTPAPDKCPSDTASFNADHRGHAVRLSVSGELDIATADSLSNVAIGALQLPVGVLVLDIHAVTFCDAAGMNALVKIQQAVSEAGNLVLTGIQPPVSLVLDLVGLSAMIPLLVTREAYPANTDRTSLAQTSSTPASTIEPNHSRSLQVA